MTTTPRIFRNCAIALPLVVLGAGVAGGSDAAVRVALAGAVATANLALLAWLGGRMLHQLATGGDGGVYGPLFAFKTVFALPIYFALLILVGPLHTVVGFSAVVLAIALTGVELAFARDLPSPSPESR